MLCHTNRKEKKRPSSLPPPCYHCRPTPFYCPSNCYLPSKPKAPRRCHCSPLNLQMTCRPRPERSPPPPTICIAGRCPQPSAPRSYCRPSAPKILPSSCVRFCIRYTNEGSSCYPCYWSSLPKCPSIC
ncbi:late cornified envelope-like proline-rich protein 1 [Ooceraea biroi]|uniref:late cornified envelope-like proline-rich protein 1 n=1 Tax=Ooceraea biroi TaxID=2015173 RepID=UPI000F08325B|nr:late cornified envelope-like proline-rich protein 1 [Ooceraea biroi]